MSGKPVGALTVFGSNTTGTTTQLDNNFAAIKAVVNDFNSYSNYLTDSGSANAYIVTLPANITGALTDGLAIQVKIATTNNGPSVMNYNATGNANIINFDGSAVTANQILANSIVIMQYSNAQTSWQLQTPASPVSVITTVLVPQQNANTLAAVDFTGLPSTIKRAVLMGVGVSSNSTSGFIVQIGPTAGVETASYTGGSTTGTSATQSTTGFMVMEGSTAANTYDFKVTIDLENAGAFRWASQQMCIESNANQAARFGVGTKSCNAIVSRVRLTTVNGTDVFDGGVVSLSYTT